MRTYQCILILLGLYSIVGCATTHIDQHKIEIISNPPGARIEINSEYIGETPLATTIEVETGDNDLHNDVYINALPNQPGTCMQKKAIFGHQKIPNKMFFEMNLCNQPNHFIIENK